MGRLEVGDEVRSTTAGIVERICGDIVWLRQADGTRRVCGEGALELVKVKPTRPQEPPVGSFFRVDRTGRAYLRLLPDGYAYQQIPWNWDGCDTWESITEPGDTITMLKLVEDKPRTNGGFPG